MPDRAPGGASANGGIGMSAIDWCISLGIGVVLGVALWRLGARVGWSHAPQYLEPHRAPADLLSSQRQEP